MNTCFISLKIVFPLYTTPVSPTSYFYFDSLSLELISFKTWVLLILDSYFASLLCIVRVPRTTSYPHEMSPSLLLYFSANSTRAQPLFTIFILLPFHFAKIVGSLNIFSRHLVNNDDFSYSPSNYYYASVYISMLSGLVTIVGF